MPNRDDFSAETKQLISKRVGVRCSNPNCRRPTSGPSKTSVKSVNIGVAAHITAAAQGGPRYDPALSPKERRSPDNAIWLCQNCAKLIDNDSDRYTSDLLKDWKSLSEEAARLDVESSDSSANAQFSDRELIQFYAQCFDRPAFQDPFVQEGSMGSFDKAIEDTITAINTGCLISRNGHILAQAKGKVYLQNPEWRQEMDTVVDLLRAIRSRFQLGVKLKLIWSSDTRHCINDRHTAEWMDQTREELLEIFARVANKANVAPPRGTINQRRSKFH
ncbi:MAG: HNH endonuclease [Candidatus Melainabacteria bacterium]|nr:HNH endonuclease [Candidatus Melainabacteria bacterium]